MDVEGRSIIVTGSSTGIGRAIAVALARAGARVVCAARNESKLRDTVSQIEKDGGDAIAVPTDVTDSKQIDQMIKETLTAFQKIDVLINNAGIYGAIGGLWEVDADTWWKDLTTNLQGPFLCCRAVLPSMMTQNEGVIINMSGGGSSFPFLGGSGYGCSKAALMRLTDTLADELTHAGHSIEVYGLSPGFVRTGISESVAASEAGEKWLPQFKEWLDKGEDHPAEDVGEVVIKLLGISCPALSGRIFSHRDDYDELARRADEIVEKDLYQIRKRL